MIIVDRSWGLSIILKFIPLLITSCLRY